MTYSPRWKPEEIEMLYSLAGDVPFKIAYATFHAYGRRCGWPFRSVRAVHDRAQCERLSFRTFSGAYLTSGSIAAMLELNYAAVNKWFLRYPDIPKKKIGNAWVYRRSDVKAWAKRHPRLFGGIRLSRLVMLFDDERFCKWILDNYPNRPSGCAPRAAPVLCIETGKRFVSQRAAAKAHHVHKTTISYAIKMGHAVDGKWHFRRLA